MMHRTILRSNARPRGAHSLYARCYMKYLGIVLVVLGFAVFLPVGVQLVQTPRVFDGVVNIVIGFILALSGLKIIEKAYIE